MPSSHLILCHSILLPPSIFPSIRVFSSESALLIRWPKYWSFSISPSDGCSGLISFRIDWLDLLTCPWFLSCSVLVILLIGSKKPSEIRDRLQAISLCFYLQAWQDRAGGDGPWGGSSCWEMGKKQAWAAWAGPGSVACLRNIGQSEARCPMNRISLGKAVGNSNNCDTTQTHIPGSAPNTSWVALSTWWHEPLWAWVTYKISICWNISVNNWRSKWQPTPGFLPGKFHGQRNLALCSPWGCEESDTTEWLTQQCQ